VGVEAGGRVNKFVLLHHVGHSTAVHSLSWSTRGERSSVSNQGLHEVPGRDIFTAPWGRLEGESEVGRWAFSPHSFFATDVLRLSSSIFVFRNGHVVSETFFSEVNEFTVVLDSVGNNIALFGGDVVHNELLEETGVNVVNVA